MSSENRYIYKLRPLYGVDPEDALMIEVINQDEGFVPALLDAVKSFRPVVVKSGFKLLSIFDADFVTEVESNEGRFCISVDSYDFCFINADRSIVLKIDSFLKTDDRFERHEVNFDDYNNVEKKELLKKSINNIQKLGTKPKREGEEPHGEAGDNKE